MSKGPYSMVTPCAHCPFRNDIRAYLREDRVWEIEKSLVRSEFPCHKTTAAGRGEPGEDDVEGTEHDEADGCGSSGHVPGDDEIHCAGALILLEKIGRPSQMMRISERTGFYDRTKLDMDAPVYDSFEEMAEACAEAERG